MRAKRPLRWQYWHWVCVGLIAAVAASPLLGLPPKGDDLLLHFYRIPLLNALWASGVPFARWLPDLVGGYGSPLFNFYPPLSSYLLALCAKLMGQHAPVAINLFLALTLLATAVGMFRVGQFLYGDMGGVVAAAAYTWSPYVLLQVYGRSSLSNALALALFPWALWSLLSLLAQPSARRLGRTAVLIAAIFLSHVASSFLFLGPLLLVGLAAAWLTGDKAHRLQRLLWGGTAVLLGLALAAFFWLPALVEIPFTRYALEAGKVDYSEFWAQLWQRPPLPIAGLANPPLPKTVGMVQMLGGLLAGVLAALALWRRTIPQTWRARFQLTLLTSLIGFGVLFLTTPASGWFWAHIAPLRGLQFPWRLLDIPALFLALTCGALGAGDQGSGIGDWRLGIGDWKRHTYHLSLIIFYCLLLLTALSSLYPARTAVLPTHPTVADATRVQQAMGIYGLTAWGEYSASTVTEWPLLLPSGQVMPPLAAKLPLLTGVTVADTTPWRVALQTDSATPLTLPFAVHYFPGWQATIDGQQTAVTVDTNGRLQLTVPPGAHRVVVWFGRTPVRWVGDVVSVLALVLLLALLVRREARPAFIRMTRDDSRLLRTTAVALGVLLLVKLVVLDRLSTPLVVHPTPDAIPGVAQPAWRDFGDVRLDGATLTPPDVLTLYWRTVAPPSEPYEVVVTLLDGAGVPVTAVVNANPGLNTMTNWEPEQLTRDVYTLPLDAHAPPVAYMVQVALQTRAGVPLPLLDAPNGETAVAVATSKRPPDRITVPETATAVDANFAEAIALTHVDIDALSDSPLVWLTLFWESVAQVDNDYTVFVHLLSPEGEIVAQSDGQPLGGVYPTSFWQPGEQIVDVRLWNPSVPPGRYRLQVGLYRLETGERLPVTGAGALGDRVIVGEIDIGQ